MKNTETYFETNLLMHNTTCIGRCASSNLYERIDFRSTHLSARQHAN